MFLNSISPRNCPVWSVLYETFKLTCRQVAKTRTTIGLNLRWTSLYTKYKACSPRKYNIHIYIGISYFEGTFGVVIERYSAALRVPRPSSTRNNYLYALQIVIARQADCVRALQKLTNHDTVKIPTKGTLIQITNPYILYILSIDRIPHPISRVLKYTGTSVTSQEQSMLIIFFSTVSHEGDIFRSILPFRFAGLFCA